MVSAYDHLRATERADVPPGTYRVVGVDEDRVTLLRVTDADGHRATTGHVERVEHETVDRAFEAAENPDSGFSPLAAIRGQIVGLLWIPRALLRWVRLWR